MNSDELVSIVLPTYNGAKYLGNAIKSCQEQTHSRWELIIVDDGSTDDTDSVIEHFASNDPRIKPIRLRINQTLPAALNIGFAHAKGGLLTWTSDDNVYRADALAEMISFLHAQPDVDVVYADCTIIGSVGEVIRVRRVPDVDLLLERNCIGACFLYRLRVQQALKHYSEAMFLAEDYDFWLRASSRFRLVPLHKDLYIYRDHENSLSQKHGHEVRLAIRRALKKNLPDMSWPTPMQKAECYYGLASSARACGDYAETLGNVMSAARCAPAWTFMRLLRKIARDIYSFAVTSATLMSYGI